MKTGLKNSNFKFWWLIFLDCTLQLASFGPDSEFGEYTKETVQFSSQNLFHDLKFDLKQFDWLIWDFIAAKMSNNFLRVSSAEF